MTYDHTSSHTEWGGFDREIDPRKVLASRHNDHGDRCVDVFARQDQSFGFEEFRRDAEDMGAWTAVAVHPERSFPSSEDAWRAAARSVVWLELADEDADA